MLKKMTVYAGLGAVSAAVLALQVLQVRVFSFMMWHHLAYMVITVALLGFGAAGAYVAVRGTGSDEEASDRAGLSAARFGLSFIGSFVILTRVPLDTFMANLGVQAFFVAIYYVALTIPFFFAGLSITLILSRFVKNVHRLYFANLVGSAAGCLLVVPLLWLLGGDKGLMAGAALAALGGAGLVSSKKARIQTLAIAAGLTLAIPLTPYLLPVKPAASKALGSFLNLPGGLTFHSTHWDPIARIDSVSSPDFAKFPKYHDAVLDRIFTIDGDAFTYALRMGKDKPFEELDTLGDTLYAVAYYLKNQPEVAIVGLGGGTDVMTALHFKAKKVTGIEINQAMIDAARDYYADFKYNPYTQPNVTIVREEGRSFLRRSEDAYDIIQMSGVDTWSALMSGAYVLSENYLYTREAYHEYFDRLKPDGVLSKMRWVFNPPREMLRIVVQLTRVLRERRIMHPEDHIMIVQQEFFASVLAKKSAFTPEEVETFKARVEANPKFKMLYYPKMREKNAYTRWFEAWFTKKGQQFLDEYPFNVSPVDDDSPFFFNYYKWTNVARDLMSGGVKTGTGGYLDAITPMGLYILPLSLIQALILSALLILVPLYAFKRRGLKTKGAWGPIAYFASLGLGFMFVEISLMQRFVLFVGHPTYAITTTLFSLLIFAGIGSMIAGKLPGEVNRRIPFITLGVALLIVLYALFIGPLFHALLGLPLTARIIIAALVLAPLGMAMGMPFPTGLSAVAAEGEDFVPWAWGVNGAAGVCASVLAVLLAMVTGFTFVLILAALIYAGGGLFFFLARRRAPTPT